MSQRKFQLLIGYIALLLTISCSIHAQQPFDEKLTYRVINLGPAINTPGDDYAPTITADGNTMFFVSDRQGSIIQDSGFYKGKNSHDFWIAKKNKSTGKFDLTPFNADPRQIYGENSINTKRNEGAGSIAGDGLTLYFTGCSRPDGLGSCDIYKATWKNGEFSKAINIGRNVNCEAWDTQPSITSKGDRMYFTSNRRYPSSDDYNIYYSDWDSTEQCFKPAVKIEEINTPGKDCAPYICSDGLTLLFSSDELEPNYGGLDFYMTKYDPLTKKWSKPVNLGQPINSDKDDIFICQPGNSDVFYFSSERTDIPGHQGKYDLYMAVPERK